MSHREQSDAEPLGPWPWGTLGLSGEVDLRGIKRAYAKQLKRIDHEDPEAFGALQEAFRSAKSIVEPDEKTTRQKLSELLAEHQISSSPRAYDGHGDDSFAYAPQGHSLEPNLYELPDDYEDKVYGSRPSEPHHHETAYNPAEDQPLREFPPIDPKDVKPDLLDMLFERDPELAIHKWQVAWCDALIIPLKLDVLRGLLALNMTDEVIELRRGAEFELYQFFAIYQPVDKRVDVRIELIPLIEEHFCWHHDGVGFSRKFSQDRAFYEVVEVYQHHYAKIQEQLWIDAPIDPKLVTYVRVIIVLAAYAILLKYHESQLPYIPNHWEYWWSYLAIAVVATMQAVSLAVILGSVRRLFQGVVAFFQTPGDGLKGDEKEDNATFYGAIFGGTVAMVYVGYDLYLAWSIRLSVAVVRALGIEPSELMVAMYYSLAHRM